MQYILLIILWILWFTVHSGMISLTVTRYTKAKLGQYYRFYRLLFNLVALLTLVPLIFYSQNLKGNVIFRWDGSLLFVQLFLGAVSSALFFAGALKYDLLEFLGIRQIISGKSYSTLSESGEIAGSGILNVTRHPWYLGAIIFVWIDYREMYVSKLIVSILLTVYLVTGTILEERKLVLEIGDSYRGYKNRVSMLFPIKWIISKL